MTINFPHKNEILLGSPPLLEVVCQIRIPPILKIAKDIPVEFQERVRHRFPLLERQHGFEISIPHIATDGDPLPKIEPRVYHFQSDDEEGHIALAVDFYALSSRKYRHWQDFASDLELAHTVMQQVYAPSHATRIGLRYINQLTLQNTGCKTKSELLDLLNPELTTLLRSDVGKNIGNMVSLLSFREDSNHLNLRLKYDESDDIGFLLDFDYFEMGKLSLDSLVERCFQYHEVIYDCFRWCLLDQSLSLFSPVY